MVISVHNVRRSPNLPTYHPARQKPTRRHSPPLFISLSLPLPGVRNRRMRLVVPNILELYSTSVRKYGRKCASALFLFASILLAFIVFAFTKRFGTRAKKWPRIVDPSTLIFERDELQRIWRWEIASGHYPSHHPIPQQLQFLVPPNNPAIPMRRDITMHPLSLYANSTPGTGASRVYSANRNLPPNVAYPPRPVLGSVADMDVIMAHCDFSEKKYVRDCLEVLRVAGGLDNGKRFRKRIPESWTYTYIEQVDRARSPTESTHGSNAELGAGQARFDGKASSLILPPPRHHRPSASLPTPCDPEYPRIFHMFWTGPFTDKPYTTLLSFLYTQNTGLHLSNPSGGVCRPQIWMWINPGPAASVPNRSALRDMYNELKTNPWASPFLHRRFKDIIVFKLWNTTEQLDGIPELRDEWRKKDLFNTGGDVYRVPGPKEENESGQGTPQGDNILGRAGSKSSSTYDRLSVILSDMARFILCHRFGGIYLDADTVFLRDWEELWGWKGAFAYRWSRLKKYNTAVLHMNKGSALGSFLFLTALKNDLDFHPMTISRYTKDAHLEELLLRLPDALFDSAWLNTEYYQRDRPPQPYFKDFADFFETPVVNSAAPQAVGFDGFFKGAFSYHFHNFWWKPFDTERNWPDLGPRFAAGERVGRASVHASVSANITIELEEEDDVGHKRDLDWATVLKRTFESYIRGERPNMYGEWLQW